MGRKLVAYFSASGVTASAAKALAEVSGADLYEIKPQIPYSREDLNWNNKQSRSSVEMNDPTSRPALADQDAGVEQYDTILIGFPIWWYVAPTIINTFMEQYDFTGKTVIAFATSGGSSLGNCEKNLKQQYPNVNWQPGKLLNSKAAIQQLADSVK